MRPIQVEDDLSADPSEPSLPCPPVEDHLRRDAVLEAIVHAAASLVSSSSTEDVLPAMLEQLGRAVGVSSVVLDQYMTEPDGEILAQPLARWHDTGEPLRGDGGLPEPMPLVRLGLGAWLDSLRRGDMIEGSAEDFPGRVGDLLRARGVRAFLAVPITMEKRLTGLLSLAECRETRTWLKLEKGALGVYAGIIGSFLHRLESDRAPRRSEERYRQVVESSNDYAWEADAEGRITYCSDRVQEVLGYPPELVVGRTPFDFLPPDAMDRSVAAFRQVAARRERFQVAEYQAISATGQIVWISTSGVPILDESGALIGYRGTTANITARKRAESVLRASEERYRGLVESQRDLIVRWTPDFHLVFANEAYYRLFGLDRQAVVGRPILETVPPDAAETIQELLEALSTPPFHVAHEQHGVTIDGRRWISWESFAVRDDAGRIVEIQAKGRDITRERASAEELLRRDRILAAVNTAAEHLLGSSSWETVIAEVIERLGQATGVARVRFWEVRTLDDGRRTLALRINWEAPDGGPTAEASPDGPFYLDEPEFVRLVDSATHLRSASFRVHEIPEPAAAMLRARGFLGFLGVPVIVEGAWWGLLTIAHDAESTPWSSGEEEALRTACDILAAAIHRQRIESSLRESEEKYRTLVEGTNQPIIIVSHDGIVHFSNGFAAAALNLTPEQMAGRNIWSLFPREHADSHMRAIRRALDAGRQVVSTHRSVVGGRPGWYEARIQPLAESWNEQRAAIVVISDISERKEAERRILEYQSRLRSLSSELALAEQRERRRIASELHDRIGQSLAMARIKLGGVQRNDSDAVLDEVRSLLDQSIQDTRTLTFELSPPILHELGLEPALEWLLERFAARHSFTTSFHGDGLPVDLPGDVLGLVFQSVQELLVNVAKHARARTVEITLDRGDDILRLEVADDGIGATPARAPRTGRSPQGFGLFSIRERIEHLGGSFTIDSQPGKGTRAQLRVPLRQPAPGGRRKGRH
jgi:PAS domain S-box-containing protein